MIVAGDIGVYAVHSYFHNMFCNIIRANHTRIIGCRFIYYIYVSFPISRVGKIAAYCHRTTARRNIARTHFHWLRRYRNIDYLEAAVRAGHIEQSIVKYMMRAITTALINLPNQYRITGYRHIINPTVICACYIDIIPVRHHITYRPNYILNKTYFMGSSRRGNINHTKTHVPIS